MSRTTASRTTPVDSPIDFTIQTRSRARSRQSANRETNSSTSPNNAPTAVPLSISPARSRSRNRSTAPSVVTLESSSSTVSSSQQPVPAPISPNGGGPETCSICLDVLHNHAVCDPCFHSFCYQCIHAWSEINNICPLCKTTFERIHYDIKSNDDYKVHHVRRVARIEDTVSELLGPSRMTINDIHFPVHSFSRRRSNLFGPAGSSGQSSGFTSFDAPHGSSFRITATRLNPNISISVGGLPPTILANPPNNGLQQPNQFQSFLDSSNTSTAFERMNAFATNTNMTAPTNLYMHDDMAESGQSGGSTISQSIYDAISSVPVPGSSRSNVPEMLRSVPPGDRKRLAMRGRKLIYHHGFRVRHYNSNLHRDVSLSFLQSRVSSITRLMQWAQRELEVLVERKDLRDIVATLNRLLRTVDITSREFYAGLVGRLGHRTGHFIHELRSFAQSPFSMDEYDANAMYGSQGVEKIATEITNEDIETWSLEMEAPPPPPTSTSRQSNLFSDLLECPPMTHNPRNTQVDPPVAPPQLVVLSDDSDIEVTQHTQPRNSHILGVSRLSNSTYSAEVISSDDDAQTAGLSNRIRGVVIDPSRGYPSRWLHTHPRHDRTRGGVAGPAYNPPTSLRLERRRLRKLCKAEKLRRRQGAAAPALDLSRRSGGGTTRESGAQADIHTTGSSESFLWSDCIQPTALSERNEESAIRPKRPKVERVHGAYSHSATATMRATSETPFVDVKSESATPTPLDSINPTLQQEPDSPSTSRNVQPSCSLNPSQCLKRPSREISVGPPPQSLEATTSPAAAQDSPPVIEPLDTPPAHSTALEMSSGVVEDIQPEPKQEEMSLEETQLVQSTSEGAVLVLPDQTATTEPPAIKTEEPEAKTEPANSTSRTDVKGEVVESRPGTSAAQTVKREVKSEKAEAGYHGDGQTSGTQPGNNGAVIVHQNNNSGAVAGDTQEEVSVVEAAAANDTSNNSACDDVLALTDDLRPKAVVPDMSVPAGAEELIATSDLPIPISESDEEAVVFLRHHAATPPLVDLISESDTDTESSDGHSPRKRPNVLKHYSSTSSDEEVKRKRQRREEKMKRRVRRKRKANEAFIRQHTLSSDLPMAAGTSGGRDHQPPVEPTSPQSKRPRIAAAAASSAEDPFTGPARDVSQQVEEEGDAIRLAEAAPGPSNHVTPSRPHTMPSVQSDCEDGGYSHDGYYSDSEGEAIHSPLKFRNRHHPYI